MEDAAEIQSDTVSAALDSLWGSSSSKSDDGNDQAASDEKSLSQGYGVSPPGFPATFSVMDVFLQELQKLPAPAVMWNGSWRVESLADNQSTNDCGKSTINFGDVPCALRQVFAAVDQQGLLPIAVFGWRAESELLLETPGNPHNDWHNTEAAELYIQVVKDFAEAFQPQWLFLGNESDHYYYMNPEDYLRWVQVYDQAWQAIKSVSPTTRVGPVFHYEHISGMAALNASADDKENRWNRSFWQALDAHELNRVDVVGLTVYPFLNFVSPGAIPDNYLQPLKEGIGDILVAITKTAWPAEDPGMLMPAWQTTAEA